MAALLAAVALVLPGHVTACASLQCEERVARHRCRMGSVPYCIRRAAIHWQVSEAVLRRKAWCESRNDPRARNRSGASGLFQFMPSTWRSTPYRGHSIWSAEWSSMAAAWMHRVGRGGEWACV